MKTLIFYGASDDLIEVEGDLREEFNVYEDVHLAVSDGWLFHVRHDEYSIWRFTPIVVGSSRISFKFGVDNEEHSDRVTLIGDDLTWVALAAEVRKL